jgi:long-chain acyl-CoA synthetase
MPINHDTSFVDNLKPSMAVMFFDRVAKHPTNEAFRYPVGETWTSVTWKEAGDRVANLAAGLLSLGIQPEQRVGIAAGTRYEWILADLAIMCAGGATTTVYPTTNAEDTAYILSDSECQVVFLEDDAQLAKLNERRSEIPSVAKVVTFDGAGDGDWVITLDQLADLGEKHLVEHAGAVEAAIAAIKPDQLATLIYTSGTTGRPKGVRLRHRSWVYEGEAIAVQDILHEDDLQFLWLPMAHSFGKVLLSTQLAVGFPTAVDGRVDKIVENTEIVKPTFMGAAPRIFEKAHDRIVLMQKAEGGIKERLFNRAFDVGLTVKRIEQDGGQVPRLLAWQQALFDRLVFSKIRARFGGQVRFFVSGAAALNREVAEWFNAAGILVLEGYGLTETSAGSFVNLPTTNRFGTVGPALPGTQVKIAPDSEVLIKGPGVMDGYHNLPQQTAETLEDGWLHTGDIGELDARGRLRITDRKKDLFKTSAGKYIAPSQVESQFKAICPYASQIVVLGDGRNFCTAVITLDPDAMAGWGAQHGMAGASYEEIVTSDAARAMVGEYVDELNARLNRWETIKKWILLDHDLTVESGELTPSMKVKRMVVEKNYKEQVDALYTAA